MASTTAAFSWDIGILSDCYNAVKFLDNVPEQIDALLGTDLRNLLVVPGRSDTARQKLAKAESEPISFSDGLQFKLNKPFIESAYLLATELDLDEMATAELLQLAQSESFAKGSRLEDAGILAFFRRYDYILNIVGYLLTNNKVHMLYPTQDPGKELFKNCLASFKKLYSLIQIQNDQIDKQKATADINDLAFVKKVSFVKQQLFLIHDLLSQILYFIIDSSPNSLLTYDAYSTIIKHVNENITSDSDVLLLHYLPALLRIVTGLGDMPEKEVYIIHEKLATSLLTDYAKIKENDSIDLSKSSLRPYDLCSRLFYFVTLIPWCKESSDRTRKLDFKRDILQYIEWLISYGTSEQLLSYAAETACPETKFLLEESDLYDFRALLQRSFPLLEPTKFFYSGNDELLHAVKVNPQLTNVAKLCDFSSLQISRLIADDILAPAFHAFFTSFVNHAAIVLTLLRDNEEDYLLSLNKKEIEVASVRVNGFNDHFDSSRALRRDSEASSNTSQDLQEIASRADLERLYMACVYVYNNRPDLCAAFWASDDSNVAGFIDWGISKNTLPLITATFCFLLGGLTSDGPMSSFRVWDILVNANTFRKNDYLHVSLDSIISSLTYYINALMENLELDLSSRSRMEQHKQEFLFSSSHIKRAAEGDAYDPILLSEDSVVFIAGFIMLISQLIRNVGDESSASKSLRRTAFDLFHPILVSFLKFDNLVTSAKGSLNQTRSSMPVELSDENRTVLINLIMHCLKEFASTEDSSIRARIWDTVDRWICHALHDTESSSDRQRYIGGTSLQAALSDSIKSELQKLKTCFRGIPMKQGFQITFTKISEVSNFVQLLSQLLEPTGNTKYGFECMDLPYPSNLGSNYRFSNQIGVWPYLEYLLLEVFTHTPDLEDDKFKISLQSTTLSIVAKVLAEVDWEFLVDKAPHIFTETASADELFVSAKLANGEDIALSFQTFVRLHHSLAALNYLFEDKPSTVLFSIVNLGTDALRGNASLQSLVGTALNIVDSILKLQDVYIHRLLPLLKNSDVYALSDAKKPIGYSTSLSLVLSAPKATHENVYYPTDLGTHGVNDFYELLSFNILSVAHLALYVGSDELSIAETAIKILRKLSKSQVFSKESSLSKNLSLRNTRLLSIFENVDESVRIRYAFVQQMESITDSLQVKYAILEFLISNLPETDDITVAHFLLGFETRDGSLKLNADVNDLSLLNSLIILLKSTVDLIHDIDYSQGYVTRIGLGPSKLSSMIMQILVRLSRNPLISSITLQHIREHDLSAKLLDAQPKIDDSTVWHDKKFQGNLQDGTPNLFVEDDLCLETFFEFIKYRTMALQYLSLEVHDIKSVIRKEEYVRLLLNDTEVFNGTPKILNFLDVLNYQFYNFESHKLLEFEQRYNLAFLIQELKQERQMKNEGERLLSRLASVRCQTAYQRLQTDDDKSNFAVETMGEVTRIDELFQKIFVVDELKGHHLRCLQSWVQIIQVLSSDGVIDRADFILKVFQYILPKINNEYYERDIMFAEELISLCMLLFDMYEEDSIKKATTTPEALRNGSEMHLQKLLPLFKTCVNGVLCSNSTPALRSDLYVLLNKFTQRTTASGILLQEILSVLRSVDKKFIDVICNDSIYSEGAPRITSIILMETLINSSMLERLTSILNAIVENNSLSLYARLLKRTGELFEACEKSAESGISVDTLLYELTAFKATLYLLIRIAQSRDGASQLFQNEIFSIIRQLRFLNVDSDLGLDLHIEAGPNSSLEHASATRIGTAVNGKDERATALITLTLDLPVSLVDKTTKREEEKLQTISYYELLVPAFQLVATVITAMGPSFQPGLMQAKELMQHFRGLVVGVMKRDELMDKGELKNYEENDRLSLEGLRQLAKLFVLVNTLVDGAAHHG